MRFGHGNCRVSRMRDLVQAVKRRQALLFVGAGVSANLGVPSLGALIERMAREIGQDPETFGKASDPLTLAEFYLHERGSLEAVERWMTTTRDGAAIDVCRSAVHRAIVDLEFPLIYTTNYDPWLERAFEAFGRRYNRIVRVADIARGMAGVTDIVKLHGDLSDPATLVFTEADYFDRLTFESPLDVKLRADVLARTVLFIGYSLSDVNIRYLLYRLQRQWEQDGQGAARPPSYLFLARPNAVHEALLRTRGIEPLVSRARGPAQGLLDLLEQLGR